MELFCAQENSWEEKEDIFGKLTNRNAFWVKKEHPVKRGVGACGGTLSADFGAVFLPVGVTR